MTHEYKYKDCPQFTVHKNTNEELIVTKDGKQVATIDVVYSNSRGKRYRPIVNRLVICDTANMGTALASIQSHLTVEGWMRKD